MKMVSFRLAAIRILKEAKKPLHYEEITKRALEQNLVETVGATPEYTMDAVLVTDIKNKKDKSPFIKKERSIFALNPNYKEEEEKEEEKEEEEIREESELISTQYIGKAGEHLVVSELLFRGYNASVMSVDEGLDIVATKNDKLYNIQVKTANQNKFNSYVIDLRISSFEKHNKSNTFTIFVLRAGEETTFVILPYVEIEKNIHEGNILTVNNKTRYRFNLRIRESKVYLGNLQNNISFYRDNWNVIK